MASVRFRLGLVAVSLLFALSTVRVTPVAASEEDPCRVTPAEAAEVAPDLGAFARSVERYVELRQGLAASAPRLTLTGEPMSDRATLLELRRRIRAARDGARQGEVFTPLVEREIRRRIVTSLGESDFRDLLEHLDEEWRSGEPPAPDVNSAYRESDPLAMMSPELLCQLPRLPEEMEYRLLGHDFVLLDSVAMLIVDLVPDVIPASCVLGHPQPTGATGTLPELPGTADPESN